MLIPFLPKEATGHAYLSGKEVPVKRYMVISPGTRLLSQENGEKGTQMLPMASPSSTLGSQAEADLGSLSPEPEEEPALLMVSSEMLPRPATMGTLIL